MSSQPKRQPSKKNPQPTTPNPLYRQIRALHTPATITIYQAYPESIAVPAIEMQSFSKVPTFKMTRMTWIKPSFLWMAYRSGYGTKRGQERVLAIEISRAGFEWALKHAVLSHIPAGASEDELSAWKERVEKSCVRVQWDPERDLLGRPLGYRSLQVGLRGEAVEKYVNDWIVGVRDVTALMHEVKALVDAGDFEGAGKLLPVEEVYELCIEIQTGVGMFKEGSSS
ncbi:hypothetical protein BJY01DRAFT_258741 [Aspergillus pseudoustus]|uniref:ATP-dependent RNA helicase DHX8 n=1 Tax=Aspergillus pseudoustus TaxID=1810923 RepID=A0ABR4JB39_9EURO